MIDYQFLRHIPVPDQLGLVIVIPCYKEKDISSLLMTLRACTKPEKEVIEIYFIINASEDDVEAHEINISTYNQIKQHIEVNEREAIQYYPIVFNELPSKLAGVGLARKIGMDEAERRFATIGKADGLIVNLDADCTVQPSYFEALIQWGQEHPEYAGCSIRFEHPLPQEEQLKDAIVHYELHLRYYIEAQKFVGLPYAFHTVGSAMCVRAAAYKKIGGMNTRKAGEDFYFIQKVIKYGQYDQLSSTTIYPSPRVSHRVPFGTGRAMAEHLEDRRYAFSYPFNTFLILKKTIAEIIIRFYDPDSMPYDIEDTSFAVWNSFLQEQGFSIKWFEIYANCRTAESRVKRFFMWFDSFRLMKFCHYYRDFTNDKEALPTSAIALGIKLGWDIPKESDVLTILQIYRNQGSKD